MRPSIVPIGVSAEDYVGEALAFYRLTEQRRKPAGTLALDFAVIHVDIRRRRILIYTDSTGGVICRPRSGDVKLLSFAQHTSDGMGGYNTSFGSFYGVEGGWQDGVLPLTTSSVFPLIDEEHAAYIAGNDEGSFAGANGNYGNLYWSNEAETAAALVALSWRGTPTRHFRLPSGMELPGFSQRETTAAGVPEYTAFGTKLYQGGQVLAEAPLYSWGGVQGRCLILGAMQSPEGAVYAVMQSDHRTAPAHLYIFSDGHRIETADPAAKDAYLAGHAGVTCTVERDLTSPGYFLVLAQMGGPLDGWTIITEAAYSRNEFPWFGDGTRFVCGNGDQLDLDGTLTIQPAPPAGVANDTGDWETDTGAYWFDTSYDFTLASAPCYFEQVAGEVVRAAVSVNALLVSTAHFSSISRTEERSGQIYLPGPPTDGYFTYYKANPDYFQPGDKIQVDWTGVDLGYCDYCTSWAADNFTYHLETDGDTARDAKCNVIVIDSVGCGYGHVTATLPILGGVVVDAELRLRDFSLTGTETSDCTPTGGSGQTAWLHASPTLKYKVFYGKSQIPASMVITSLEDLSAEFLYEDATGEYACWATSGHPATIVTNPQILNGNYISYNGSIVSLSGAQSGRNLTNVVCPMPYRQWYWTGGGWYFRSSDACWSGCTTYVWVSYNPTYICFAWLSDSWLAGLVDDNGDPVTVPHASEDGYLIKAYKVETYSCT